MVFTLIPWIDSISSSEAVSVMVRVGYQISFAKPCLIPIIILPVHIYYLFILYIRCKCTCTVCKMHIWLCTCITQNTLSSCLMFIGWSLYICPCNFNWKPLLNWFTIVTFVFKLSMTSIYNSTIFLNGNNKTENKCNLKSFKCNIVLRTL